MGKGDTIKIEARKAVNPPVELAAVYVNAAPRITGDLTIDGVFVGAIVSGTTSSSQMPGDGISFFYTSQ